MLDLLKSLKSAGAHWFVPFISDDPNVVLSTNNSILVERYLSINQVQGVDIIPLRFNGRMNPPKRYQRRTIIKLMDVYGQAVITPNFTGNGLGINVKLDAICSDEFPSWRRIAFKRNEQYAKALFSLAPGTYKIADIVDRFVRRGESRRGFEMFLQSLCREKNNQFTAKKIPADVCGCTHGRMIWLIKKHW